jgi:hypothetical protein
MQKPLWLTDSFTKALRPEELTEPKKERLNSRLHIVALIKFDFEKDPEYKITALVYSL